MEDITEEEFYEVISSVELVLGLVLVQVHATWCGPCKALTPVLGRIEDQYLDILFYRLDVEQAPQVKDDYDITVVPTLLLFVDEELADRERGVLRRTHVTQLLDKYTI